jgi:C4-dicarboxylate-specific signal transduction histidine kinase
VANENRILELVASGGALEIVLETLCRSIEQLMPGSWSIIRLVHNRVNPEQDHSAHAPEAESEPADGVDLFGSHGLVGQAPPLCSKRTIVDSIPNNRAGLCFRRKGICSYWLEPIESPTGDLLGVLAVYGDAEGSPGAAELASGAAAARLAALAIERTRSEERARHQLAQLAHVSRLATMGEMASGLAHELNQPLCAIVNFTEACAELVNSRQADSGVKALADVTKQAARAGDVIRRLREFVRRREPEREVVDLNSIVREVMALTNNDARRHEIHVRLKLGDRSLTVRADPIQIQQVLVNLVRNAFDAMCGTPARKRVLTIRTIRQKEEVEVLVSDTGSGVPETLREKLFESFFSTKDDGMGMGLSISRSILEAHNGRIWATPNGAHGTTFRFTLPTIRSKKT